MNRAWAIPRHLLGKLRSADRGVRKPGGSWAASMGARPRGLSMNRAGSGRDAFHRVRDFSWAQPFPQNRDAGGPGALGSSFERVEVGGGFKENRGTRWNASQPGSWSRCMRKRERELPMNRWTDGPSPLASPEHRKWLLDGTIVPSKSHFRFMGPEQFKKEQAALHESPIHSGYHFA